MISNWASKIIQWFILTVYVLSGACGLQCLDEEGQPVDWYVVYKLPKLSDASETSFNTRRYNEQAQHPTVRDNLADGVSYMYLDANNQTFRLTSKTVNDSTSAFYRTLAPIYTNNDSLLIGYGFYNDETPDNHVSSTHGHTKGAFAFDSNEGFWILLSVPKFPNIAKNGYSYPKSGTTYGQNMLCISLSLQQFDVVGKHFQYTYPQFYSVNIPEQFNEKLPNLVASAVDKKHVNEPPYITKFNILSNGGVNFTLLSKYKDADEDIVSEYMSEQLQSDLYSATWQNGRGDLPSMCNGTYWTWTVKYLNFRFNPRLHFENSKDHSKWAMGGPASTSHPSDWVCIGDMNRQTSQETRCGGYACWHNSHVNKQYVDAVTEILQC